MTNNSWFYKAVSDYFVVRSNVHGAILKRHMMWSTLYEITTWENTASEKIDLGLYNSNGRIAKI